MIKEEGKCFHKLSLIPQNVVRFGFLWRFKIHHFKQFQSIHDIIYGSFKANSNSGRSFQRSFFLCKLKTVQNCFNAFLFTRMFVVQVRCHADHNGDQAAQNVCHFLLWTSVIFIIFTTG